MSGTGECLDENAVVALFESRLAGDAKARADEHLASCATCRRVLAEYAAMAPRPNVTVPLMEDTVRASDRGAGDGDRTDERVDLGRRVAHAQARKRVGTTLCNKWKIEGLIGIGGMAQVFHATHRNGRAVAVKVMRPELAVEPTFVERFLREGYVANKVGHPGAVAILDDDMTPDGAPFLVMELLHGRTLAARLHESGCLPVGDALRIVGDVLDVLAAAHDKGIVHRDLKPENLFETEAGEMKLLDFGIARLREGIGDAGPSAHTQSGMMMGTLGYMPPEQARGQGDAVDARSDLWAVGATLFTLTTGRVLHEAATPNEALLLAMTAPAPPVHTVAPTLPVAVADLIDKALAFDKSARFADARAMQGALEAAQRSSTVLAAAPIRGSVSGTLLGPPQTGSLRGVSAPSDSGAAVQGSVPVPEVRPPSRGNWALIGALATVVVLGSAAAVKLTGQPGSSAAPAAPPVAAPVSAASVSAARPAAVASEAEPSEIASHPVATEAAPSAAAPSPPDAGRRGAASSMAPAPPPVVRRPPKPAVRRDAAPADASAHPYLDPLGPRH